MSTIAVTTEAARRLSAALLLALLVVVCTVVAMRYGLAVGRIWLQELAVWLNAAGFLLAFAAAWRDDAHVRVDIFYRPASGRFRRLVDCIGTLLLLLPLTGAVIWLSLPYVVRSWAQGEASREPGGLPALFLLKTLLPVAMLLLALQALAQLVGGRGRERRR